MNDFLQPTEQYRIRPFWFWNGDLTEETIAHQICEMKAKGLGGFFICARQGLKTAYLSSRWFELVRFACEKASQEGLEAWLYDEYPYPSGMAGGEVLLQHPEAEHKILQYDTYEENGPVRTQYKLPFGRVLYAKAFPIKPNGKLDYSSCIDLREMAGNLQPTELYQVSGLTSYNQKRFFTAEPARVFEVQLPAGHWSVHIYIQGTLGSFKYYGAFFDPCNKVAVKTFLQTTHEKYQAAVGQGFGATIKGMFSDEVGLYSPIPWSGEVPDYFERRYGYSILEHLPALHNCEYPDAYRIRFDLYDAVHRLFLESYHKQTASWCDEHKLAYATEVPSMRMTTQRYSSIIGGDAGHEKLGKPLEEIYDKSLHHYRYNAVAVSSLQRQLGRDYAMIESFHSVGWSMTLQDAKWMFDRLAASGINFYNVHAFYYTIDSITKHDAPPSQFLQNPYWRHYGLLADYAARLSAMVTNTNACIEVAVLDPVASLWACVTQPFHGYNYSGTSETEQKLCEQLRADWSFICKTLLFNQIRYEHLDVEILAEANIKNSKLRIGKAEYSVLVIPPSLCVESVAAEKVRRFIAEGGSVIALGMLPHKVIDGDCNPADTWQALFDLPDTFAEAYQNDSAAATGFLLTNSPNVAFFRTQGCVSDATPSPWLDWCRQRLACPLFVQAAAEEGRSLESSVRQEKDGSWIAFLANQGGASILPDVHFGAMTCETEEYVLESGEVQPLGTYHEAMAVTLLPYQSRLLRFKPKTGGAQGEPKILPRFVVPMKRVLPVTIRGGNIYRIGSFQMSLNQQQWVEVPPKTFIEQCADSKILSGEQYRFDSLFGLPREISIDYPLAIFYRQEWYMDAIPEEIGLLMDRRAIEGENTICINNRPISTDSWAPCFVNDHNNLLANISSFAQAGLNTIEVQVKAEKGADGIRDPLYLYGSFGVAFSDDRKAFITSQPKQAAYRDSFVDGFPFYSGEFTFLAPFTVTEEQCSQISEAGESELVLDIGTELYHCFEISVNGHSVGTKVFAPYIWRMAADAIKPGENTAEIKITNTLSNMLDGTYFDYDSHELVQIG